MPPIRSSQVELRELGQLTMKLNLYHSLLLLLFVAQLGTSMLGCWGIKDGEEVLMSKAGYSSIPTDFCSDLVAPYGYACREHKVLTEDGFLLGVQRISSGQVSTPANHSKPPVVLQHGLLLGGDCWLLNPPGQSLAFILADAGYEVWIVNGRGTRWSRHNEYYTANEKEFWDWSWDELATYDLPAVFTFVYKTTGSQLFYVGHSQGTIIGLAALTQPEVINMVAAAALLSPITYLDHITSKFLRRAALLYIDKFVKTMGVQEFNLRSNIGVEFVDLVCSSEDVDCGHLLTAITGPNCCFNNSRIPYYLEYEPQSTSLKNMQHLAQMIRAGTFAKFDYGFFGNIAHYLSPFAPSYDLLNIPKSFAMWMASGGNDYLSDSEDIEHTMSEIVCNPRKLYLKNYGHIDFLLSTTAKEDLYDDMISFFDSNTGQTVI